MALESINLPTSTQIDTLNGHLANIESTNKSALISIGTLSNLETTEKSSVVAAINEVVRNSGSLDTNLLHRKGNETATGTKTFERLILSSSEQTESLTTKETKKILELGVTGGANLRLSGPNIDTTGITDKDSGFSMTVIGASGTSSSCSLLGYAEDGKYYLKWNDSKLLTEKDAGSLLPEQKEEYNGMFLATNGYNSLWKTVPYEEAIGTHDELTTAHQNIQDSLKTYTDNKVSEALPLVGGTMEGNITFDPTKATGILISNNSSNVVIAGGTNLTESPCLTLNGIETSSENNKGSFVLSSVIANSTGGTATYRLIGRQNGHLIWSGTRLGLNNQDLDAKINRGNNLRKLEICGGADVENGSSITLVGSLSETTPGQFFIKAKGDSDDYSTLIGTPDGSLTWKNSTVLTEAKGTALYSKASGTASEYSSTGGIATALSGKLPKAGGTMTGNIYLNSNTRIDNAFSEGGSPIAKNSYGGNGGELFLFSSNNETYKGGFLLRGNYNNAIYDLMGIEGSLTWSGTFNATKVYNSVWNDYAEFFERGEETENGDIISLSENSDKEVYVKATDKSSLVVGVQSDSFAHIIGGSEKSIEENMKDYIPVGLSGRVYVKFIGKSKLSAGVVPSSIKGVGRLYDPDKDSIDKIIGYIVYDPDNTSEKQRKVRIIIKK